MEVIEVVILLMTHSTEYVCHKKSRICKYNCFLYDKKEKCVKNNSKTYIMRMKF